MYGDPANQEAQVFPRPFGSKYVLLKHLATGGMADVFLARQTGSAGFSKECVIKRILPNLARDQQFITMFLDEARLSARLNHPNIAQIFDLGQVGNDYFIAMEYVDGVDLERIIDVLHERGERCLPPVIAARICASAAAALEHAHNALDALGRPLKIVHRDVTPSNIVVSFEGVPKLLDFGIAKAPQKQSKTDVGIVRGKAPYMSPEQIMGDPLDARSDLFSLGVILYEITTGVKPFDGDTAHWIGMQILEKDPKPPSEIVRGYPKALEAIVLAALAKRREDRLPSGRVFQNELEKYLISLGTPATAHDVAGYIGQRFSKQPLPVEVGVVSQPIVPESGSPKKTPVSGVTPPGGTLIRDLTDDLIFEDDETVDNATIFERPVNIEKLSTIPAGHPAITPAPRTAPRAVNQAPVNRATPAPAPLNRPAPAPVNRSTPAPAPLNRPAPAPVNRVTPAPAPVARVAPQPQRPVPTNTPLPVQHRAATLPAPVTRRPSLPTQVPLSKEVPKKRSTTAPPVQTRPVRNSSGPTVARTNVPGGVAPTRQMPLMDSSSSLRLGEMPNIEENNYNPRHNLGGGSGSRWMLLIVAALVLATGVTLLVLRSYELRKESQNTAAAQPAATSPNTDVPVVQPAVPPTTAPPATPTTLAPRKTATSQADKPSVVRITPTPPPAAKPKPRPARTSGSGLRSLPRLPSPPPIE